MLPVASDKRRAYLYSYTVYILTAYSVHTHSLHGTYSQLTWYILTAYMVHTHSLHGTSAYMVHSQSRLTAKAKLNIYTLITI